MLILNRDRVTIITIMITTTMAVIEDISNKSSNRIMVAQENAQRTTWAKSRDILQSSSTTLLVVAAVSISLVVMITLMFSHLTAKYLLSSVDQTLTMVSIKVALTRQITITSRGMEDNNNSSSNSNTNNLITTEEKLTTTTTSMIITRAITQISPVKTKHSSIITIVAVIMLLAGPVKTITTTSTNSSRDNLPKW